MDKLLLKKLMSMARLELDDQAQQHMLHDLDKLCGWIEELQTVDTTGVEPLTTLALDPPILREDIPQEPLDHTKALSLGTSSDGQYFNVPKSKMPT